MLRAGVVTATSRRPYRSTIARDNAAMSSRLAASARCAVAWPLAAMPAAVAAAPASSRSAHTTVAPSAASASASAAVNRDRRFHRRETAIPAAASDRPFGAIIEEVQPLGIERELQLVVHPGARCRLDRRDHRPAADPHI